MLTLMCGVPGSGKSTFAKQMAQGNPVTVLTPDDFRFELTGKWFHPPAEDTVWSIVKTTVRVLLRTQQSVIIDATTLTKHRRAEWVHIAKDCNVSCKVWALITPAELCIEHNAKRDRTVPEVVLERQMAQYTVPALDEGFQVIHIVTIEDTFKEVGYADNQIKTGCYSWLSGRKVYTNFPS
jgi:predicted kinase